MRLRSLDWSRVVASASQPSQGFAPQWSLTYRPGLHRRSAVMVPLYPPSEERQAESRKRSARQRYRWQAFTLSGTTLYTSFSVRQPQNCDFFEITEKAGCHPKVTPRPHKEISLRFRTAYRRLPLRRSSRSLPARRSRHSSLHRSSRPTRPPRRPRPRPDSAGQQRTGEP